MGDEPLRVAIVGAGVIGELHADVLATLPRFQVTAVVSRTRPAADRLADRIARSGSRPDVLTDLTEAFPRCDVVAICTPNGTHGALAEQALGARKHVVIEKPIEVTLRRAMRVSRAAAAAPESACTVISQHRFDPSAVAVHDAVHSQRLGRPTSGVALLPWWRSERYYASADWRATLALDGGGALMNQGIHTLDLLLWMMGPVRSVHARQGLLAHRAIEVEDTLAATIDFQSGAIGTLLVTTAAYPQLPARLQVHGSLGSAVIEDDELVYFHSSPEDRSGERHDSGGGENTAAQERARVEDGRGTAMGASHARQYEDLARAIDTGSHPRIAVDDAVATLAVVEALYRSARWGEDVLVEDVLAGGGRRQTVDTEGRTT